MSVTYWTSLIAAATGIVLLLLNIGARRSRKRIEAGHAAGADIALIDLLRYVYNSGIFTERERLIDALLPREHMFDQLASAARESIEKVRFAYPEEVDSLRQLIDRAESFPSIAHRIRNGLGRGGGMDESTERDLAQAASSLMELLMGLSRRASDRQEEKDIVPDSLKPSAKDLYRGFQQRYEYCVKENSRLSESQSR
jgi:hypothetical protein